MGLFNRQTKHYVFDHKPIYYNPKKEQREKRFQSIRKELGVDEKTETPENFKAEVNFRSGGRIGRTKRDKSSTVRLLAILVILAVFSYFFLYTDVFEKMTQYFVS